MIKVIQNIGGLDNYIAMIFVNIGSNFTTRKNNKDFHRTPYSEV